MPCTRCFSIAAAISIAALLCPSPGAAQFAEYKPPSGVAGASGPLEESFEEALESARWRLGALRAEPWFGIKDVGYVDRQDVRGGGDDDGDFTATLGAGLRAYLPLGGDSLIAAHVLPEYVYWADDSDRSRLNGRFGAGWFGFFNRLSVEASATRSDLQGIATPEFAERFTTRTDRVNLGAEVRLAGSLAVFGRFTNTEIEGQVDDLSDIPNAAALRNLDREEQVSRVGVRLLSRSDWTFSLGYEESDVDFPTTSLDRSNSGSGTVLEVTYPGTSTNLRIDVAHRSIDPEPDSGFLPFDGFTGEVFLGTGLGRRFQPTVWAQSLMVYSIDSRFSYSEVYRFGAELRTEVGWRTALSAFVETGEDDYASQLPGLDRADDFSAWGVKAELKLDESKTLIVGYSEEDYDSNLPGFDRSISRLEATISFAGAGSAWF